MDKKKLLLSLPAVDEIVKSKVGFEKSSSGSVRRYSGGNTKWMARPTFSRKSSGS